MGRFQKIWQNLIPNLSPNWKVIEIDLWGHGESTAPKEKLTEEGLSKDIFNVIKESGSTDCYVIGHSMGCAVSECFALFFPKVVKGLILIEGIYPLKEMFASKGRSIDDTSRLNIFQNMLFPLSAEKWAIELTDELMRVPETTLDKFSRFLEINRVEILNKINCAYFIISREKYKDEILQPDLWEKYGILKDFVFHVKNTQTHFVLSENPKEANKCITNCLENLKNRVQCKY